MNVLTPFTALFLAGIALAVPARAQESLSAQDIPEANRLIDTDSKVANSLKCHIEMWRPFIDFDFRYVSLFGISANGVQFAPGDRLTLLLRITSAQGKRFLLARNFQIPAIPRDMVSSFRPKSVRIGVTGGFAIGEGRYVVELLLYDDRGHKRYRRWNSAAIIDRKETMTPALAPSTVAPLLADRWDGKLDPNGFRLTVLLDARATRERTSDLREERFSLAPFLLPQVLASLLRQVPCESVTVVAFNLAQEREIFRQEQFDAQGFARLSTALKNLQPAVVSYQALQRGNSAEFLVGLVEKQISAQQSPDAVIFIGPNTHVREQQPKRVRNSLEAATQHFFYFEYFGFRTPFPDAIDYLTRDLHGTVFRINSVQDFGTAVEQLQAQLATTRRTQNSPNP
jgi:hypothetical protein